MDALTRVVFDGLPISFQPWQVLYVMALFVVLVFLLDRMMYRPVLAVLAERAEQIESGRGSADDSEQRIAERERQVAEKLARARTDAVARLEAAKGEAEGRRAAEVGEARGRAEERVAEARTAVSVAAAEAEKQLGAEAAQLGRRIASRLLGRELA